MPSERIARVLWGVNVDLFHPGDAPEELRRELALEPGVPVLLAMRGVRPIQNPETVLRALALLRARGTEAILVLLLGPGGFKALPESLSSELDTLGVRDLVREVGELPHARLAELYRAADVCVSVPTTDSTSIAVLEAMASGCPIVASDIPANREWIDDGREGRLVPAGDETALADALESMLSDPSQLRAMGEAALERVNGVVDERTQMDRVAALYRELTG
jgi:glycosyltransferase involved in cell wall biosynthesis